MQNSSDQFLTVFEGHSIPSSHQLLDDLCHQSTSGFEIIEARPQSTGGHLILVSSDGPLQLNDQTKQIIATDFVTTTIKNASDILLKSIYSLHSGEMDEVLLSVQCRKQLGGVGEILTLGQLALSAGLSILDLRTGRGWGGLPFCMISGLKTQLLDFQKNLNPHQFDFKLIENPSKKLQEFFV